jgi:hypothetical protein
VAYSFSDILAYLNIPDYKSWGWRGSFRVRSSNASTGQINLYVSVELIDVNYDTSRLKPLCEDIVNRRLNELDTQKPGIIAKFKPKVNVSLSIF